MSAKIVPVPPPLHLANEDLRIAEEACRANAARALRRGANGEADHWQRVADEIAFARDRASR